MKSTVFLRFFPRLNEVQRPKGLRVEDRRLEQAAHEHASMKCSVRRRCGIGADNVHVGPAAQASMKCGA
ncbi:hypothetical protein [Nocardia fluminea]|uniref:hypothetical protein n=1 Tax=Nocardia fluminea TaxID=134984 RepID=UPI003F4D14C5